MKKHSMRIIFVSLLLIMQSVLWVATAEAGESVQDKVESMEPVIKTYANCRGILYYGDDHMNVSCTVPGSESFWDEIRIFSIFNSSASKGGNFTYSADEITAAAYAMYSNFDGNLPEYPDYYYTGTGFATVDGNTVTFIPATPELQRLDLMQYEENDDNSIGAIYLQEWESYEDDSSSNSYYITVHMVPNKHINNSDPKYYTIKFMKLDRTLMTGHNE